MKIVLLLGGDITWDPWIVHYATFASWQETNTTVRERKNSESSRFRCPVSSVCLEEAYIIGKTVVPLGWGPRAV